MSYTPTTWADGDLITAEKLNHIEQGVQINERNLRLNTLKEKYFYINPPSTSQSQNAVRFRYNNQSFTPEEFKGLLIIFSDAGGPLSMGYLYSYYVGHQYSQYIPINTSTSTSHYTITTNTDPAGITIINNADNNNHPWSKGLSVYFLIFSGDVEKYND